SSRYTVCFFFSSRRRHTRWPRDWSSDVCSSDLKTHKPGKTEQLVEENCIILILHGGVEGVVPAIKENTHVNHRESERDHDHDQPPSHPAVLREPVRPNHAPCSREQLPQASCG